MNYPIAIVGDVQDLFSAVVHFPNLIFPNEHPRLALLSGVLSYSSSAGTLGGTLLSDDPLPGAAPHVDVRKGGIPSSLIHDKDIEHPPETMVV